MRRIPRWWSIALCILAVVLLVSPAVAQAQTTALFMDSQPGDYIGQGATRTYTTGDATFTATRNAKNGVRLTVIGPAYSFWWYLDFSAAGGVPLAAGTYEAARRYPFSSANALDFSGSGRGCNTLTGRFIVREVVLGAGDAITKFSADFEQHCEDGNAGLFGTIRYQATSAGGPPFDGAYPTYRLDVEPPTHGILSGGGLNCGSGGAQCQLTFSAPQTVPVTATPDAGYRFAGWTGDCDGGSTAFVRVNSVKRCRAEFLTGFEGTTALFYDSQAGDFIGQGQSRVYTPANGTFTFFRNYRQGVSVSFFAQDGSAWWTLDLSATDAQPLTVGAYTTARRFPSTPFNGLSFSGSGRGCNELTGRFLVREIAFDPDGTLATFAADFEQHCEDLAPALYGGVRYHSSVEPSAFGGTYPLYRLTLTPPDHGRIQGPGVYCTPGAPSCALTLPTPTTLSLIAVPDPGYIFTGWTDDCVGGASTSVLLHGVKHCSARFEPIVPTSRTLLRWDSQPNHFIGRGGSEVLSLANSRWVAEATQNATAVVLDVSSVGATSTSLWFLTFQAPSGEVLHAGRRYAGAGGTPGPGKAGFSISGNGRFCGGGEFTVREYEYGAGFAATRFSASFILDCGRVGGPRLTGVVQYNSSISLEPTTIVLDPNSLSFASVLDGTGVLVRPSPQTMRVSVNRNGASWTVTSDQPWIHVSPAAGTDTGTVTVSLDVPPGLQPRTTATGTITVASSDESGASVDLPVSLTSYLAGASAAPFGYVDTPAQDATGVTGAIPMTGWALDDVEVASVTICRAAVTGEAAPIDPNCGGTAALFIGNAVFIEGARPDVQVGYRSFPRSGYAGWGFMVLTNNLPNQGNGTFVLSAYATDREGHTTLLGSRRITCDNAHATAPFGAIDTPGQGETVAGNTYVNFGWALTQNPKVIPPDGSTMMVYVDGVAVGRPSYGHYRSDIATTFPGLANSLGAVGFKIIDTTTLVNGLHTIVWTATDSAGVTSGLGSRYFRVANSTALTAVSSPPPLVAAALPLDRSALVGRRTWDARAPWQQFQQDDEGRVVVRGEELDRLELRLGGGDYAGYSEVGGVLQALPAGSSLDAATGVFTWSPGVGFVGSYDLVFIRQRDGRAVARRDLRIVLEAKGSGHVGPQVVIDAPGAGSEVSQPFGLGGWAIDRDAVDGTGVDAVHVWAYPVPGGAPLFLGPASHGIARPDVAAVHGGRFAASGYGLTVDGLAPGTYDLAVFAWSEVVGDFVPARVVRVTVW